MTLTKAEKNLLEALFEQELPGQKPARTLGKTKTAASLIERGLIESMQFTLGRDRFGPVVVEGYCLTTKGHIAYCDSCHSRRYDR